MSATNELPCSECGAPLAFEPGAGLLKCPFCGTENEIEGAGEALGPWGERTGAASDIRELDYHAALADQLDAAQIEEVATVRWMIQRFPRLIDHLNSAIREGVTLDCQYQELG